MRLSLALALATLPLASLAAQKQTAADTADYKCVMAKFDTLKTANGVGQKRNLATSGQACATRGFTRDDSIPKPPPPTNAAPVARFTFPTGGCVIGQICTFDGSTSSDDKAITKYEWSCPPGAPACSTSTGATASTVYSTAGSSTVVLKVSDAQGLSSTVSRSVPIASPSIPPDTVPTPPPTNTAPVAVFVVSDSTGKCKVGKPCTFDASASRDDKAVTGYTWDCGVFPNCPTGAKTTTAVYPHPNDTRTVVLTVRDSAGLTNTISRQIEIVDTAKTPVPPDTTTPPPPDTLPKPPAPDTLLGIVPPALPKSEPDFQPKPCIRSVDVVPVMLLQAALNNAQPGDCLELDPSGRWQGNFKLPTRTCSAPTQWITIRTKGVVDVPGVRMDSIQGAKLATIVQANNQYAIGTTDPTQCWQLMHLNITRDTANAATLVYHLMVIGFGKAEGNTSQATNPKDIIIRRNWIHGTSTGEMTRCIAANGMRIAIVDNLIDDCHASGFDSQAIEGWNGAGPILIENNFLAGAGENIMFGGADPAVPELRPSDITIRRNHIYKRPEWKGRWSIKNIFELKNAQRLLIEGNVFENSWAASQIGFAIVIKSATGGSLSNVIPEGSTDIMFTYNRVNNANLGFNVVGKQCFEAPDSTCIRVERVIAQNNLFTGIGASNGVTGSGWLTPIYSAPANLLIRNNTFVGNAPDRGLSIYLSGGAQADWNNIRWRRNIFAGQSYYAMQADNCGLHQAALDCAIGTGKWTFSENVVSEVDQTYWAKNPAGNVYKVTQAELGLQSDFSAPLFPGIGADIPTLTQKTAGVVIPIQVAAGRRAAPRWVKPKYKPIRADSTFCGKNACMIIKDKRPSR